VEEYIKKESIINRLLYLRAVAAEMPMSHDDYVELKLLQKLYEECSNVSEQNTLNIVRCKDCRFQGCYSFGGDTLVCENPIKGLFNTVVYENDFCNYAERRQE
jgi:hypothetical protein